MKVSVHIEKKININFSKAKTKSCLTFHDNSDNSYLFVNGKEIYKFEVSNKNVNIPSQFCLGSISNKFDYVDSEEISFEKRCIIFQLIMMLLINLTE